MHKKTNLAIIFGGKSAEHEVSIVSARNIAKAVDRTKFEVFCVAIDKFGQWLSVDEKDLLAEKNIFAQKKYVLPFTQSGKFFLQTKKDKKKIDVVFPVLHGTFGEDGTIQGLFKIFNVPFVGPSVLGSAVCMDKDVAKRLLRDAGIPVAKFLVFKENEKKEISFGKIKKNLGLPFFIKPANLGSSIGISKVKNKQEFLGAIKDAFQYDNKIIIEENISGKEIECSVLGNENPLVSVLGEIIPAHEFYSYEAKYLDADGAKMAIPANIPKEISKKIQILAKKTFQTLCCEGMGRVDFFLTSKDKIFVNEINTIPGFTSISMYPKLWEKTSVPYSKLITKLIKLAIERFERKNKLKIDR